jgi:alkylation response protein AidB-like acyl-CoA dehydrogenase
MSEPIDDRAEERRLFRDTVRDFCEGELRPLVAEAEASETFPRDRILPAMANLGLFRIGVPEEEGGAGGDTRMQCVLAEEIARVCGGFAVSVLPAVVAPAVLRRLGSPELRDELLEPLMNGRLLPAIALSEPGAGSDLLALRTTVRADGDEVVLNGGKIFVTNGPCADLVLVAALRADYAARKGLERAAGLQLVVVPADSPGFGAVKKLRKLGMRSSETGELVLDECRVPARLRLGGGRGSLLGLMKVLDHTRLYVAALSVGLARAAFEASLAHARQRQTFGKPIGNHQAIAFKLARMATDIEAARLLVDDAAARHDRGERASARISMAKLFATEAGERITAEAVQIHGGYGYMTELPVERFFRDAKVGTIWEGTSEIQQLVIARDLGLAP